MAMDSIVAAAARALAGGDALGALKLVALRDDAPALALRGIAMAQLGDYSARARSAAARRPRFRRARAAGARSLRRCGGRSGAGHARPPRLAARVGEAAAALEARADRANALQARLIAVRRLLLLGRLDEAAAALARVDVNGIAPSLLAVAELAAAELALRSLSTDARACGARSRAASRRTCARAGALGRGRRSQLPRSTAPPRAVSRPARSGRCGSKTSKRCTPRARSSSTLAVAP